MILRVQVKVLVAGESLFNKIALNAICHFSECIKLLTFECRIVSLTGQEGENMLQNRRCFHS